MISGPNNRLAVAITLRMYFKLSALMREWYQPTPVQNSPADLAL